MVPRELILRLVKPVQTGRLSGVRQFGSTCWRSNVVQELEQRGLLEATTS